MRRAVAFTDQNLTRREHDGFSNGCEPIHGDIVCAAANAEGSRPTATTDV